VLYALASWVVARNPILPLLANPNGELALAGDRTSRMTRIYAALPLRHSATPVYSEMSTAMSEIIMSSHKEEVAGIVLSDMLICAIFECVKLDVGRDLKPQYGTN